jgi:hypothetical protein
MQLDDRTFGAGKSDPFLTFKNSAGTSLWQIPYENIKKGIEGLKWQIGYFSRTPKTPTVTVKEGSSVNKLGVPAGIYNDPRPLSGDALLTAAIAAYNTGQVNVLQALAAGRPPDLTTARTKKGGSLVSYAASILSRVSDLTARAG